MLVAFADRLIYCSIGKGRGSGQSKEYQMQVR